MTFEINKNVSMTKNNTNNKVKPYLIFISIIAMMGGLMFGFELAIISGAVPFIQEYFNWNELELGWGVSSLLLGAIVGSLLSGFFADKYGRKKILIYMALLFAISCIGAAQSHTTLSFILYRIIGGVSVGAASVLSPMYVAEVVPSRIRGTMVSIYQLSITFGILTSYLINYLLHDVENNWRWMFASGAVPSVLFFIGLFFIPETPRWLLMHGYKERAQKVLLKINNQEEANKEIEEIELSDKAGIENDGIGKLFSKKLRKPLLIGLFLAVFVQITGINTVIDYAPKILLAAGFQIKSALLQTLLIGIINFLSTFIAIWLVDKVGRKPLYMVGSVSMFISLLLLSLSFWFNLSGIFALISILLFIASFAALIGPIFWTLVSELFPNRIRGKAIAVVSFTQWVATFLIVLLFPYVLKNLGGALTFFILSTMSLIQLVVVWRWLPETKGKTLEEIEGLWEKK